MSFFIAYFFLRLYFLSVVPTFFAIQTTCSTYPVSSRLREEEYRPEEDTKLNLTYQFLVQSTSEKYYIEMHIAS